MKNFIMNNLKTCITLVIVGAICIAIGTSYHWISTFQEKVYTEDHELYIGRLTIPSVGIDVACYEFDDNIHSFEEMDTAMDENDAAVKFWKGTSKRENGVSGSWIIADHNNEGFAPLHKCAIGDLAYIVSPDGVTQEYVVTANLDGINDETDLTVNGKSVLCENPGGIILYTCKDFTQIPVYIIFLQPAQ